MITGRINLTPSSSSYLTFLDKDNDLRCRVNKRANKLYGSQDSPAKQQWVQEEFEKRRQKRMDKERRKHLVNNVLSVPNASNTEAHHAASEDNHTNDGTNNNNDANTVSMLNSVNANQMQNFYTPLPQIDTATAAKLLDFPTDLQRQLLEQLNNSMMVRIFFFLLGIYFLFMEWLLIIGHRNIGSYKWYSTSSI